MDIIRNFFSTKVNHTDIYIWYNGELGHCGYGTLTDFEIERIDANDAESCKLICSPGFGRNICKDLVKEINEELFMSTIKRAESRIKWD